MGVIIRPAIRRAEAAARKESQPAGNRAAPSLAAAWHSALTALAANGPGACLLATAGFGGATLLGLAVLAVTTTEAVEHGALHATGPLVTWSGLAQIEPDPGNGLFRLLLAQAALGLILTSFARGALAHLALTGAGLGAACAAALRRLPALVAGALAYAALVGAGAVGVNAGLREAGLDLTNAGQRALTVPGALQVAALRGVGALIPSPGSPAADFLPYTRVRLLRDLEQSDIAAPDYDNYAAPTSPYPHFALSDERQRLASVRRVTLVALAALILGGVLLRFHAAAAMQAPGTLRPIWASIRLGARHFGAVAAHAGVLQLAAAAFMTVAVILPIALAQCFLAPPPASLGMGGSPINLPATLMSMALVDALVAGFVAIYDARLFAALR